MQFARQRAGEFVFRDADRLVHTSQSVFDDDVVAVLAEDQADGRGVGGVAEFVPQAVALLPKSAVLPQPVAKGWKWSVNRLRGTLIDADLR